MSVRNYSTVAVATTTTSSLNASVTTIPVTALSGYPPAPFTGRLEGGTANEEIVTVTAVSGLNLTVIRGVDGSTAKSHLTAVAFDHAFSARDFAEPNAHVNASAGVHGIAGNVVGDIDTQSLSNKTLVSPTIGNPTFSGTATGLASTGATLTSPTLTGATLDSTSTIDGVSGASIATINTDHTNDHSSGTAFTPAFTNFTLGNGTSAGKYKQVGKYLDVALTAVMGSTSSISGAVSVTLPNGAVTPNDAIERYLQVKLYDSPGNKTYWGFAYIPANGTTASIYLPNGSASPTMVPFTTNSPDLGQVGANTNFTVYGRIEVQ